MRSIVIATLNARFSSFVVSFCFVVEMECALREGKELGTLLRSLHY